MTRRVTIDLRTVLLVVLGIANTAIFARSGFGINMLAVFVCAWAAMAGWAKA